MKKPKQVKKIDWFSYVHDDNKKYAIPIGPRFQADVAEWNGPPLSKYPHKSSGQSDSSKWLGTVIWSNEDITNPETERDVIGRGRTHHCDCYTPGSILCVKRHISEKTANLQKDLGPAFHIWKFDEMGEVVGKLWKQSEQQKFARILKKNLISEGGKEKQTKKRIINSRLKMGMKGKQPVKGDKMDLIKDDNKRRRISHDSNNDFEMPCEKQVDMVVNEVKSKKVGKKVKKKEINEQVDIVENEEKSKIVKKKVKKKYIKMKKELISEYASIRTRMSPRPLFDAILSLSNEQRKCVKKMGFGKLLHFRIDEIPGKIGYYVVDKFDGDKMEISLSSGSIKITKDSIHDMLGIPNAGIHIYSLNCTKLEDPIIVEWRKQYGTTEISAVDIMRKIVQSDEAGWNFKINFIMLFSNIMGEAKTRGKCNLSILPYIREDTKIEGIDWCRYVLTCLKDSKLGWKRNVKGCYYTGPITVLTLLYVDGTLCNKVAVPRHRPAIKSWTTVLIREREDAEIDEGGFGLVKIHKPIKLIVKGEGSSDNDIKDIDNLSSSDDSNDKDHDDPRSDGSSDDDSDESSRDGKKDRDHGGLYSYSPKNVKGYLCKMETLYERVMKDKFHFQSTTKEAMIKYPNNDKVKELNLKFERLFGDVNDSNGNVEGSPINYNKSVLPNKYLHGEVIPHLNLKSFKEIDKAIGNTRKKVCSSIQYNLSFPQFSLYEDEGDKVEGESIDGQHGLVVADDTKKRKLGLNLTNQLRSSYVKSIMEINKISKEEKRICKYVFAKTSNGTDPIFATRDGQMSLRDTIESLEPSTWVFSNVIDSWATLLNYLEEFKNRDSPYRLFFHTTMMIDDMLEPTMTEDVRLNNFKAKFMLAVKGDQDLIQLRNVDLVFFPVGNGKHFYVICVNLKNPAFVVIDNNGEQKDFDELYGDLPMVLQNTFSLYLKLIGHCKTDNIANAGIERLEMRWRTVANFEDCGIFAMRHMETYMGYPLKNWDCGFDVESRKQKMQLECLRYKYVAKLLLSDINILRSKVMEEVEQYEKDLKNGKAPRKRSNV